MSERWRRLHREAMRHRRPKLGQLLDALDEVNPTPFELSPAETAERYAAKAELQTRLIVRHGRDLELRPDGDRWLLALRGGRDAKHVVRYQLGSGAQEWFAEALQRHHINEAAHPDLASTPPPEPTPRSRPHTVDPLDECLAMGDYDSAVDLLEPRARGGDVAAATQLLEILVEYLDQPARAVAATEAFPDEGRRAPSVAGLYALALVRQGALDEAVSVATRIEGPQVAPAYKALLSTFLGRDERAKAAQVATRLLAVDPTSLEMVDAARAELAARQAEQLEPLLMRLRHALADERWDEAEATGAQILEQDATHGETRRALARIADVRRREAADQAMAEGARFADRGDASAAFAAFRRASSLGHSDADSQLERAQHAIDAAQRSARLSTALQGLRDGTFTAYVALADDEREEVRASAPATAHPVLEWLDACPAGRARDRIALATACWHAQTALSDGRAAEALRRLDPHHALVSKNRAARALAHACQQQVDADRAAVATARLREAEAMVDGPLEALSDVLDAIEVGALDPTDQVQHASLRRHLGSRTTARTLVERFERWLGQTPLRAWRLAKQQVGPEWEARAERAEAATQRAFRVTPLEGPVPTADLMLRGAWNAPLLGLDRETNLCWLVSRHAQWTELVALEVGTSTIRRGLLFRGVGAFLYSGPDEDGHLWVSGGTGVAAVDLQRGQLVDHRSPTSRRGSIDVVATGNGRWFRDGAVEGAWTVEDRRGAPARRIRHLTHVMPVAGCMDVLGIMKEDLVYVQASGRVERLGKAPRQLRSAFVHPADDRRLVVVCEPQPEEIAVLCIGFDGSRTDLRRYRVPRPLRARGLVVAGAAEEGCCFALVPKLDDRCVLECFDESGLKYEVDIDGTAALVMDRDAMRCGLLVQQPDGVFVHALTASEPPSVVAQPVLLPASTSEDICEPELDPQVEELACSIEFDDGTLDAYVEQQMEGRTHAERIDLLLALSSRWPARARAVAERWNVPLAASAELAVRVAGGLLQDLRQLDMAEELLVSIDEDRLPEWLREHYWHLRGMLRIRRGDPDGARAAFERPGAASTGACGLQRWARHAEQLLVHADPDGAAGDDPRTESWRRVRRDCRSARSRLADGDVEGAWEVLSEGPVAHCELDETTTLRAYVALQHEGLSPGERIRVLARAAWRVRPLALLPEGLPDDVAAEVVQAAERALTE